MTQNTRTPAVSSIELAALIAILVGAAVLRFGWLGVNSFAWDEARISLDALRMARGGEFILAGQPSSVEIPFFPASVWLFAIPFAISPDPQFATLAVAFVSWLTVLGVWALGRRFGVLAGLLAALYMAASPYAVFYGRSIWQPNLLAPLALVWLWAWVVSREREDRRGLIASGLVGLVGVLTVQVHFAGVALVLGTTYAVLRHFPVRKLLALIAGGVVAALCAIPYLYYTTVVDPRVVERFGSVLGGGVSSIDLQSFGNLLRLAVGWEWGFLGLGDLDPYSGEPLLPLIVGIVLLVGCAALFLRLFRARRTTSTTPLLEAIVSTLLILPLVFLRHSTPVLIHYQLVTLPAVAIVFGAAGSLIPRSRVWQTLVVIAGVGIAVVWGAQIADTLNRASVDRPPNSALSSILRESRDAALMPDAPVLFFTHGDDPALHGEVAVFESLLYSRDHRILNGDNLLILPPYPATLMATLAPFQMWEELVSSGLARNVKTYPRRQGAEPFIAATYDGHTLPSGFSPVDPVRFDDGMTLIGWRARYVGPRLRVSTLWRVEGEGDPGTYQQFHHLWAADQLDGDPLSISDVSLSRTLSISGDLVVVMADFFDTPRDQAFFVDIGHYTLESLSRVPTESSSDSLRLGPFFVGGE